MTKSDLQTLLDFHYWARNRVLEAAAALSSDQYTRDLGGSFKSVRDTLAHLYSAEWAWYQRWEGLSPTVHLRFDDYPDVETLRRAWTEQEQKVRAFLAKLGEADVARIINYRLFSGQAGASPFWQMLQHMVNHGSYHRGQVTTMLRQLGAKPPASVDMITYYREHEART
jgi:uncharacterized damage-inducible protein DinB